MAKTRRQKRKRARAESRRRSARRTCGGCTFCCRSMAVQEIGKDAWAACPEQVEGGCGVYADRPAACQTFRCGWLGDDGRYLGASDRPDKCGVMLAGGLDYKTLLVHEVEAGRWQTLPRVRRSIERLRSLGIRVVVTGADGVHAKLVPLTIGGK